VTASDGKTEVLEIGSSVRRAQSTFSRESSIVGLKKNFIITAREDSREYELKFVPNSVVFRRRLNYLIVKLNKHDFLPRSLEVDGKSGVNSVFDLSITSLNAKLPASSFEVTKPK
jgi:outer membrane lipoprotein-sorting protein